MSLIPSYNFLFNNKDYFLEHNLGDLPIQFIQRIGAFQNCEVVHGVMAILPAMEDALLNIYRIHQGNNDPGTARSNRNVKP